MTMHAVGMRAWLWQRLSAVYITLFLGVVVIWAGTVEQLEYTDWIRLIGHPAVNIAVALFILSLLFHVGVGVRDILVDYIKPLAVRFILLVMLVVFLLVLAIWSMLVLVSVVAI